MCFSVLFHQIQRIFSAAMSVSWNFLVPMFLAVPNDALVLTAQSVPIYFQVPAECRNRPFIVAWPDREYYRPFSTPRLGHSVGLNLHDVAHHGGVVAVACNIFFEWGVTVFMMRSLIFSPETVVGVHDVGCPGACLFPDIRRGVVWAGYDHPASCWSTGFAVHVAVVPEFCLSCMLYSMCK